MSGISESQYQHARNVWNQFKLKNMGYYHDLYLKTDVILPTYSNRLDQFVQVIMDWIQLTFTQLQD